MQKDYSKNFLDEAHPIVFKKWETWSRANVGFTRGEEAALPQNRRQKSLKE